jgi:hypothetical protein
MTKLLTEPRILKEASSKPKKKRLVKKDKPTDVKYSILREGGKRDVDELFRIYKEDPFKARVKFYNKGKGYFNFIRLVLFEFGEKDFEISQFQTSFGISVTNRIYSSQKKMVSISFKNGKFWYINNMARLKKIVPLNYSSLLNFIQMTENSSLNESSFRLSKNKSKVLDFMHSRFPWIQMLSESEISYATTFSVVYSKKLFGMKDLHRYIMNSPNNVIELVLSSRYLSNVQNIKQWKTDMKYLDGVEHLTTDFINSEYFNDTLRMAKTLGRKINCRWGLKRLKEEHDKWSREITRIILDCEIEYTLNIRPIFKAFADFSGYKLLSTNKDMLHEGMLQNHCVGTYIDKVDRGECAIFHVDGYTLQVNVVLLDWEKENLRIRDEKLRDNYIQAQYNRPEYYDIYDESREKVLNNVQFKGKHNEQAPQELVEKVEKMIYDFVIANGFENTEKGEATYRANTNSVLDRVDVFGDLMVLPF